MKIDYQKFLDEAMLEIVAKILTKVQNEGLPSAHHFYISFNTQYPGVHLSPRMKQRYPKEITIVLQYQFTDLQVTKDKFSIKLSFDGIREKIEVPFQSLTSFVDPGVHFSLQFKQQEEIETHPVLFQTSPEITEEVHSGKNNLSNNVIMLDKFRNKNKIV